jgi:cytidylate kinase
MIASQTFVVTISRQIGAGGAYVGQGLARRLGVRYVDREILQQAAVLLGREEGDLEPLEERAASVWDRMASILSIGAPEAPFVPPPLPTFGEDELFEVESQVMREIASRQDAVFVGRGASWVLRDHPVLLSVFLHATEERRAQRILQSYRLPDVDAARQLVKRSDQQRARFLQSLLGVPWTSPGSYDLCINTTTMDLDDTVEMLARLVETRKRAPGAGL